MAFIMHIIYYALLPGAIHGRW